MYLGAHESIAGKISKSIKRAYEDGCESMQIFVKNANRWQAKPISDDDAEEFRENSKKLDSEKICAHSSYLINMATTKTDLQYKSLHSLKDELQRCDKLGIGYFVVHPGSHTGAGEKTGLDNIVSMIDNVYSEDNINCHILLETTSGQGSNLGYDLSHFEYILNHANNSEKLGLCLDTCHLYSAGYDLKNNYERVISDIFEKFEDKVKFIHLNDSKFGLNSRKDRHEFVGKGYLGIQVFEDMINDARLKNIPGILETPEQKDYTYKQQLDYLKSLRR